MKRRLDKVPINDKIVVPTTTHRRREYIDRFYETTYTASTVKNILELKNKLSFTCKTCRIQSVDSNIAVQDMYHPTFVVTRKNYCLSCWLVHVTI